MQLTLAEATEHPVQIEFRHDPPLLPAPEQAENPPLLAQLPVDLITEPEKQPRQIQVNLHSGELHLLGGGGSGLISDSRSADELRLTLYTKLVKSWEATGQQLPPSAATLLERLQGEIERLSRLAPPEQAPGISVD